MSPGSPKAITQLTIIVGIVFVAVLLALNTDLFRRPIYEWADYAANSIQIQNAKHFRELLGNYSRWGFHHPGPVFFYVFAAGELLLHDWLRLAPEAMNAHVLCMILINTFFLFSAIWIFARQAGSPIFILPAALSALIFAGVVSHTLRLMDNENHSIRFMALSSVWMPHVILFCFLLFLVACAVVACGNLKYLPLATLTGLMLIHAHVTQLLFVVVLTAAMAGAFLYQSRPASCLVQQVRTHRKQLIASGVLVCMFAAPPVIEALVHKPNNVDAIREYLRDSPPLPNPLATAFRYELSFFTFLPNPEAVLAQGTPHLLGIAVRSGYVIRYWLFVGALLGILVWLGVRQRLSVSPFVRYIWFEICLVSLLFLYWGMKIAGGLANFNGYFFYSVQLLPIFAILSTIVNSWTPHKFGSPRLLMALSCAVPLLMFASPREFRISMPGAPEVQAIASAAQGRAPLIQLVFGHDDWPTAVGVASRFKRAGQAFCVAPWFLMFGPESHCHDFPSIMKLVLTHSQTPCTEPCQVLLRTDQITAELIPYPALQVPFTLSSEGWPGLFDGFHTDGPEGSPMWTSEQSSIRFLTASERHQDQRLRMTVVGTARPGRPAELRLNGNLVGALAYGQPQPGEFSVPGNWLKSDSENVITFSVPRAGPAGQDVRHLGFLLEHISVDNAGLH